MLPNVTSLEVYSFTLTVNQNAVSCERTCVIICKSLSAVYKLYIRMVNETYIYICINLIEVKLYIRFCRYYFYGGIPECMLENPPEMPCCNFHIM